MTSDRTSATTRPSCRACGSTHGQLRGREPGEFIPRAFESHPSADWGFMFVEPFSGYEIYNDAYYRGHGPDPYVDYETEYNDWRRSDRGLEFDDMAGIADGYLAKNSSKAPVAWLDFGCGAGAFLKYLRERGSFR